MKRSWRRLFVVTSVTACFVTSVAWAATQSALNLVIPVQPAGANGDNSTATGGQFSKVTSVTGQLTVPRGAADNVDGGVIFQIDYGDSSFSNMSIIDLLLQDPLDMDKIFHDNKMVVHVYVYYPAPSTATDASVIKVGTTDVKVYQDTAAKFSPSPLMSPLNADVLIQPSVSAPTLYITTSVNVYHDNGQESTPSGQDGKVTGLQFFCNIRPLPH